MLKVWSCFLGLCFGFYANADTCSRLVRTLIKPGGMSDLLTKRALGPAVARRAEKYVHRSSMELVHLYEREALTTGSFRRHLSRSLEYVALEDVDAKLRVFKFLDRDAQTVSKEELVGLVNDLMYLGNRYGYSLDGIRSACRSCVDEDFYDSGFRFVFRQNERLREERVYRYMETMFPRRLRSQPWEVDVRIRDWMRHLELGYFLPLWIPPEERKTLAFFLAMSLPTSPVTKGERELIEAIVEVSRRPDGEAYLLDPENSHNLWKIFDLDLDEKLMGELASVLRETASLARNKISKKEAFFQALEGYAEGDALKFFKEPHHFFN